MKRATVLLLVLFAGFFAGGLVWMLRSESPEPVVAGDTGLTPDTAPAPLPNKPETRAVDQDPQFERASLFGNTALQGMVILPVGCEPDPTLEVYALSGDLRYARLATWTDDAQEDSDNAGVLEELVLATALVRSDGHFEIQVPPDVEPKFLQLRGRYLHLEDAFPLPEDEQVAIEIIPIEGCYITGQLIVPPGAEGEIQSAGVELTIDIDADIPDATTAQRIVALEVTADQLGRFEFRGVPTGFQYKIIVEPENFAPLKESLDTLTACGKLTAVLQLSLGGRAAGVVVNAEGAPVAGASVEASLPGAMFGFDDSEVRTTTSDDAGVFELVALPPGTISLRASKQGLLDSKKAATPIVDGSVTDGIVLELVSGKSIDGKITWPDGEPAAGIEIEANFDEAFYAGQSAFNALRGASGSTTSNSDGSYSIQGLGGGPFRVDAEAAPREGASSDQEKKDWFRARRDAVRPGKGKLDLVLWPPLGIRGKAIDVAGNPVTKFSLHAARMSEGDLGEMGLMQRDQAVDSADGSFFFADMIEGRWRLTATADGYTTIDPLTLELPMETESDPVTITMMATATVTGTVFDTNGQPHEGAVIRLDDGQPDWAVGLEGMTLPDTSSESDGTFELTGLAPRSLGVYAEAEGFARSASVALEPKPGEVIAEVELRLTAGGTLTGEVYDDEGELVSGRLIIISHMGTFDRKLKNSDGSGEFIFENLAPGTWQVIAMDKSTDFSDSEDGVATSDMMNSMKFSSAEILEGETTHVVIGAPPEDPVKVSGKVIHGDEPYRGALVSFFPAGSGLYENFKTATVDADGRYSLTLDGPGEYSINVQQLPGDPAQHNTIEFAEDIPEATEHILNFKVPVGRISGRVTGPDGKPAAGARITLLPDEDLRSEYLYGGQFAEIPVGPDGTYDIQGLRPGTYSIAAGGAPLFSMGDGARFGRLNRHGLKLAKDEWMRGVDFTLPAPGSIAVSCVDSAGAPVVGATLFVRGADGRVLEPFSMNATDGSGRGICDGLSEGTYTVIARVKGLANEEGAAVGVRPGESAATTVVLTQGTVLLVKLKSREGEDLRANVRVEDANGREVGQMISLQDIMQGGFSYTEKRVGPLPPGKYKVFATDSDGRKASKPVTLRGELERVLKLRLK